MGDMTEGGDMGGGDKGGGETEESHEGGSDQSGNNQEEEQDEGSFLQEKGAQARDGRNLDEDAKITLMELVKTDLASNTTDRVICKPLNCFMSSAQKDQYDDRCPCGCST